jgi:hypothetical protein
METTRVAWNLNQTAFTTAAYQTLGYPQSSWTVGVRGWTIGGIGFVA